MITIQIKQIFQIIALGVVLSVLISSCAPASGEHPGNEFMPDMFHSTAYEANTYNYYSFNTWSSEEEYAKMAQPRIPVAGTIPMGAIGLNRAFTNSSEQDEMNNFFVNLPINGYVPFYYENTEEERLRATSEISVNPMPITEEGLRKGKLLYDINCGICHGEKADGNGYLVRDGSPYPAQPANMLLEDFVNSSDGRYYFAIMYGKNVMGSYKDKLSYSERWDVIHYIRSIQASEAGMEYSHENNTFNSAVPSARVAVRDTSNLQ